MMMLDEDRGFDVFLAHNSEDKESVETLARRLAEESGIEPFLDKWNLVPGEPWQEDIEWALENSAATAVFIGPNGISPWHNEEMRIAIDRAVRTGNEHRVIPVLLPGAHEPSLDQVRTLARRTWVDFRSGLDDPQAFSRLEAGILGHPPEDVELFTLPDEPRPYPGLLPFTTQQADFFFGRERDVTRLRERVESLPFTAIVGASGSGKSSLVRAGLLPQLPGTWRSVVLTPGTQPATALADELATLMPAESRLPFADTIRARLMKSDGGLTESVRALLSENSEIDKLLIVIDQFEELFTQLSASEERSVRASFVSNLVNLVQSLPGKIRVLVASRLDFVPYFSDYADLTSLLETNQVILGRMQKEALREAIVYPARQVGAMFEKGLVNRILEDIGDHPAILPHLGLTLARMWERRQGVWLTHAVYEDLGGIGGAIDQYASRAYGHLGQRQQAIARNILTRMVFIDKDGRYTTRKATFEELNLVGASKEEVHRLIKILSDRDTRLLSVGADTVELVHDSLIEEWNQLRNWLQGNHEALLLHRQLTQAAELWRRKGRERSYLYRSSQLTTAHEWVQASAIELNVLEREFLDESLLARKRRRILRVAAVTVAVAVLSLLVAFLLRTQSERRAAEAVSLVEQSENLIKQDPQLAALLALESLHAAQEGVLGTDVTETLALVHTAMGHARLRTTFQWERAERSPSLAWRSDGREILTQDGRGSVAVWGVVEGNKLYSLDQGQDRITHAKWSHNGDYVVTVDVGGQVRVWDAITGENVFTRVGHKGEVLFVAWSYDDTMFVTTGNDGYTKVWDAEAGEELAILDGSDPSNTALWSVEHAAWSRGSELVATVRADGTARVWNLESGVQALALSGDDERIVSVAWSKDDERILTRFASGFTKVWDVTTREEVFAVPAFSSSVVTPVSPGIDAWSSSSRYIAGKRIEYAGTDDEIEVEIWDAFLGERTATLKGDVDEVTTIEFSPGEQAIATGSDDGNVRVWSVTTGNLLFSLPQSTNPIVDLAWSPDGTHMATSDESKTVNVWEVTNLFGYAARSDDVLYGVCNPTAEQVAGHTHGGVVKVWDAFTGRALRSFDGVIENELSHLAWHENLVLATDYSGAMYLWNALDGNRLFRADAHSGSLLHGAVSPNDLYVATASFTEEAAVWDVRSGEQICEFTGHHTASGPNNSVLYVAWSPDSKYVASGSRWSGVSIWESQTCNERVSFSEDEGDVEYVDWSTDGQHIITLDNSHRIKVWEARTGDRLYALDQRVGSPNNVAVSRSADSFASASSSMVSVRDFDTGRERLRIDGASGDFLSVEWSPTGDQILTLDVTGAIRVWDATTGDEVLARHIGPAEAEQATWCSLDGSRVLVKSKNGATTIYATAIEGDRGLVDLACRFVGRNMTSQEWQRYLSSRPFRRICPGFEVDEDEDHNGTR